MCAFKRGSTEHMTQQAGRTHIGRPSETGESQIRSSKLCKSRETAATKLRESGPQNIRKKKSSCAESSVVLCFKDISSYTVNIQNND